MKKASELLTQLILGGGYHKHGISGEKQLCDDDNFLTAQELVDQLESGIQPPTMCKVFDVEQNPLTKRLMKRANPEYIGEFIGFGADYRVFGQGIGNFTCAVVKNDAGAVQLVRIDLIEFI